MPQHEEGQIVRRYLPISLTGAELRKETSDGATLAGYAARYEVLSVNLGGFREKIARGFFDDMLIEDKLMGEEDTKSAFNHNPDFLLSRTNNGTHRVKTDDVGLYQESDLIDTTAGRDCRLNVKTKRVTQMSFAFNWDVEDRYERVNGENIRTLLKGQRLFDTAPVTYPAYLATNVGMRSLLQQRGDLNFDSLLNAVVAVEHKLPVTRDEVALLRSASQKLAALADMYQEGKGTTDDAERQLLLLKIRIAQLG